MRSFRARLTLWNAVVIAIVLVAFSAGIVYTNQARLAADIDHELADRALHGPQGPGPGGGFGGNGGFGRGPGPGGGGGFGQGQGNQDEGPLPPRFNDPAAIRFADVRRPRWFDAQGNPIGQMQDPPFDSKAINQAIHGNGIFSDGEFEGEPIRIFTTRRSQGPNREVVVQVARQVGDLKRIWSAQLWTLLLFLPGAILGAAVGGFFLTNRATRPIGEMKKAANAISEQDLSQRLEIHGHDEFAELGETFNAMVGRLEESFSNLKGAYGSLQEAHENQKRFTADASHELRTPLTRLRLATSSALSPDATEQEKEKALMVADAAAQTMGRLVQEMLVLARADAGQLKIHEDPLDLRVLASEVAQSFSPPGIELDVQLQESPVTILGDADHLRRVLTNLLENAIRHSSRGGVITVAVRSDNGGAILSVQDHGDGISPQHLPHITERFYRADSSRSRTDGGVGLGLAICKTIVDAHHGELSIESQLGKGTSVTIRLPLENSSKNSPNH